MLVVAPSIRSQVFNRDFVKLPHLALPATYSYRIITESGAYISTV